MRIGRATCGNAVFSAFCICVGLLVADSAHAAGLHTIVVKNEGTIPLHVTRAKDTGLLNDVSLDGWCYIEPGDEHTFYEGANRIIYFAFAIKDRAGRFGSYPFEVEEKGWIYPSARKFSVPGEGSFERADDEKEPPEGFTRVVFPVKLFITFGEESDRNHKTTLRVSPTENSEIETVITPAPRKEGFNYFGVKPTTPASTQASAKTGSFYFGVKPSNADPIASTTQPAAATTQSAKFDVAAFRAAADKKNQELIRNYDKHIEVVNRGAVPLYVAKASFKHVSGWETIKPGKTYEVKFDAFTRYVFAIEKNGLYRVLDKPFGEDPAVSKKFVGAKLPVMGSSFDLLEAPEQAPAGYIKVPFITFEMPQESAAKTYRLEVWPADPSLTGVELPERQFDFSKSLRD